MPERGYELYRWFMLRTVQISDEDSRQRDAKMMLKINRILGMVTQEAEAKQEVKQKYKSTLIGQVYQPILGEQFCLKDIYMSLQGKLKVTFLYSPDGGSRWSEDRRIPLSGFFSLGNTGLTAEFHLLGDSEFVEGDIYTVDVAEKGRREEDWFSG